MPFSNDQFEASTAQNLKTGGDGSKSYNWWVKNSINADAIDANQTNAGYLTIDCNVVNSGIGATSITGPYAYQLVTGDFDISTFLVDNQDQVYEQAGMLVASDSNDALHAYILMYAAPTGTIAARNSDGSTETVIGTDNAINHKYFRITRSGNVFTFYRKAASGDAWTSHGSVTRSDLGTTIRVGLYAGTNNANNNYVAKFDWFGSYVAPPATMFCTLARDDYWNPVTAGASDGTTVIPALTSGDNSILLTPVEPLAISESDPRLLAIRATAPGAGTALTITPGGTEAALVALAPDNGGVPGTWGAYGAALALTSATTNVRFWIKTKGAVGQSYGNTDATYIAVDSAGYTGVSYYLRRQKIPSVTVQGTAPNHYIGADFGGGAIVRNSGAAVGDINVNDSSGAAYADIVYASYTQTGTAGAIGSYITFATKTLVSGLTLTTVLLKVGEGKYKVTHTFNSTTNRYLNYSKVLQFPGVASAPTSLSIDRFNTIGGDMSSNTHPFQTAGVHHAASGVCAALVAGNGFDNDYCFLRFDNAASTSWYNTYVTSGQVYGATLNYGAAANGLLSSNTLQVAAGVPRDSTYVISLAGPTSQDLFNEQTYSAYHDVYSGTASGRNPVEKMLWATTHQNQMVKRSPQIEGAREWNLRPSSLYSSMISIGDILWGVMGLGDSVAIIKALSLLHRLGPPDGAAAASSVAGCAANNLDGTYGVWVPFLELYARQFLGYSPDSAALAEYLATADAYASKYNAGSPKLIPDAATRKACLYSDMFAGAEGIGYGDFAEPFTFPQSTDTRYRWVAAQTGGTLPTRITGVDGGVTPRTGNDMAKAPAGSTLTGMRIATEPSKSHTASVYINAPSALAGAGAFVRLLEYDAAGTLLATTDGASITAAGGWTQATVTKTTAATTATIKVVLVNATSNAVACYFADAQCTLAVPTYPGLFWSLSVMPPQLLADTQSPGAFAMVWTQLNLKCLKILLGANWTAAHEATLVAVDAAFPAAYWYTNSTDGRIKDDIYHPTRKNWLTSWGLFSHFIYYLVSGGQKIHSDTVVANIYNGHPKTAAGLAYGTNLYKGWVVNPDGTSPLTVNDVSAGWPTTPYFYINAGGWLWAIDAMFHTCAKWANIAAAALNRKKRLKMEVSTATYPFHSHESMTSDTHVTTVDMTGYSANALMLVSPSAVYSEAPSLASTHTLGMTDTLTRSYSEAPSLASTHVLAMTDAFSAPSNYGEGLGLAVTHVLAMTDTLTSPGVTPAAPAVYDLLLGRIALPTLFDSQRESVGDQLEQAGATLVAGERRARPANLSIPVHATGADSRTRGDRMRRQLRALLDNPAARMGALYLRFPPDTDLSGWLLIGGGDLEYDQGGVTFSDYKLTLSDAYRIARFATHLEARRIEIQDRRLAATPRDTKGTLFSTDFASQAPAAIGYLPYAAMYTWRGGTAPSVSDEGSIAGLGGVQRIVNVVDGDVILMRPPAGGGDAQLVNARVSDVIVFDRGGVAPSAATALRDIGAQAAYGWEEIYGPGHILPATGALPTLAATNGYCRCEMSAAGVITVEQMGAAGYTPVAAATVTNNAAALTVVDASVVNWTPDSTLLRYLLRTAGGATAECYVTLRRGWTGPRVEVYATGGVGEITVRPNAAGTTALARSDGTVSPIVHATAYGNFAARSPYFTLVPASGPAISGGVVTAAAAVKGSVSGTVQGVTVSTPATAYASVHMTVGGAPDPTELALLDVRTIPTYLPR